jgi:alpha-L-fucosidase
MSPWKLGDAKTVTLHSVHSTAATKVTVLGQSDEMVEYRPGLLPKTTWKQDGDNFQITAYRAQRLYTDRRWPNPIVLKMTNVEPGLSPPEVQTAGAKWDATGGTAVLSGKLLSLGKVNQVEVGFQYREKKGGTDLSEKTEPWTDLPGTARSATGDFQYSLRGLAAQKVYEYRARVKHPLITMYGEERSFQTAR